MNTVIYYFSGTGNSLFLAKELQKDMPDSIIVPIVGLMKEDKIQTTCKTVGVVFPVHALTIPIVVRKFISKLDLTNTEYVFAVASRGAGTVFHGFKRINRTLKKQNRQLNSGFIVDMYNSDSRHGIYHLPTSTELEEIEQEAIRKLDSIKNVIAQKLSYFEDINDYTYQTSSNPIMRYAIERAVLASMEVADLIGGVNYFYHDEHCTGCGICEKVCLSGKIDMLDNQPQWQKEKTCYMCFACLNFCPAKAVQINDIPFVKSNSVENGRYPHPYATVSDMQAQKCNANR